MFIAQDWKDYEVIDTGNGEKLERWGGIMLRRPDPSPSGRFKISMDCGNKPPPGTTAVHPGADIGNIQGNCRIGGRFTTRNWRSMSSRRASNIQGYFQNKL